MKKSREGNLGSCEAAAFVLLLPFCVIEDWCATPPTRHEITDSSICCAEAQLLELRKAETTTTTLAPAPAPGLRVHDPENDP
eukprot:841831-Amphidinium_carterae.1